MAIVWQRNIEGNYYEVRTAGATLRLYRNGVNHSQWNPNRPLAGCIWDLITLPALHRPVGSLREICILGFGAGAVGRQMRELIQPDRIVGVDLDEIHLSIADGFFDCAEGCELVAADAVEWVRSGSCEGQFDYVVDDLYAEENGLPVRCAPLDAEWAESMVSLLKPEGMLVYNLVEPEKVKHLPPFKRADLRKRFPHAMVCLIEGYENRIVAFSPVELDKDTYKAQLRAICRQYPASYGVGRRYKIDALR
ncbi:hypothetical protein [Coraliomargarita parva]|uniref:hypothetical protein n=1 Tax=Coraliomargarita parva TaxID=3014050 RepID=UPI0022B47D4E|nr:hypothetical protein [Coraliomargarita parva]